MEYYDDLPEEEYYEDAGERLFDDDGDDGDDDDMDDHGFDEEDEDDLDDDGDGVHTISLQDLFNLADDNDDTAGPRRITLETVQRLLRTGVITAQVAPRDDDGWVVEDDDDDDDDDDGGWLGWGRRTRPPRKPLWPPVTEPVEAGRRLESGGEFGKAPPRSPDAPASVFDRSRNMADLVKDKFTTVGRRPDRTDFMHFIPNSCGTEVARYASRCYCGQFSEDSSFFYTCTKDFRVHLYDTTTAGKRRDLLVEDGSRFRSRFRHQTSLKEIKTIQGRGDNWTITDANLSPDNRWMIYSSICPEVWLVSTRNQEGDHQALLDFSARGGYSNVFRSGIWSIRFSGDSREVVAGAHAGDIFVYDIEARRPVLRVAGHDDDVNAVCFADSSSSNVLISGSDDSFVKVWDRRSLRGGKPAGVLPGHTEGITYVSPKGDGRYCISNGKDQSLRLWDLRKMVSSDDFERLPQRDYGLRGWDYRTQYYRKPRYDAHPNDCSVMVYRGHSVLQTLIRCHFSPAYTTGQKYLYSGSADGMIHIWSLDGRIVQVLDRSLSTPLYDMWGDASDPSAPEQPPMEGLPRRPGSRYATTVRDVSWHSQEPTLMSTAWDGSDGMRGSIAKHEWKGYGKNGLTSLEDAVEAQEIEKNEMERTMPGGLAM